MKKKIYYLTLLLLLLSISVSAQENPAANPSVVSLGNRLQPAAEIIPLPSAQDVTAGESFTLTPGEWEKTDKEQVVEYKTRIKIPRTWAGRRMFFRIEGVTSSYEVKVNGEPAGYSQAGMQRSEFDITRACMQDYNEIVVAIYKNAASEKIENHREHKDLRLGNTLIYTQPEVRIRDMIVTADPESSLFSLEVLMQSHLLNTKSYTISYELTAPDGQRAAQGQYQLITSPQSNDTVRFSTMLDSPLRWNHETPHLYHLAVKTVTEGRVQEVVVANVGFRIPGREADNIFTIDGNPIKLYPTEYQAAASRGETVEEVKALKKQGINLLITKGMPQPGYFYDICDFAGMYVCVVADVNTSGQPQSLLPDCNPSNDPAWKAAYLDRALGAYYTSRLHPCVVIYSPAMKSMNGYCLYESYIALKGADATRPIFYPDAGGQWNSDDILFEDTTGKALPADVVTFDKSNLYTAGKLGIRNELEATSLKGKITIRRMAGKKVVEKTTCDIDLRPGKDLVVDVPLDYLTNEALKSKGVSIEMVVRMGPLRHEPTSAEAKPVTWKGSLGDLRAALTDTVNNDATTFTAAGRTDI